MAASTHRKTPPNNRQSPRETIYKDVIRGLYDGRFVPGQRLVESKLTALYDVSRGPVREALNRLAAAGVVELIPQRGACIRMLTINEAIDALVVAEGLITIAARLAAEKISASDERARMQNALSNVLTHDSSNAPGDPEHAHARDKFYAELTSLSENKLLGRSMPSVEIHLLRIQFAPLIQKYNLWRHEDYMAIEKAVNAGDPVAAERAVRLHFARSLQAFNDHRSNNLTIENV